MAWRNSKENVMVTVTRDTITVSVLLYYDIGDQRKTVMCCFCSSLVTVKDI